MRTNFSFLIFTAALIAVTMGSCKKEDPLKELEINLNDNTEISATVQIRDYQTGNVLAGAVIKDEKGVTVATSDEQGMATCTKKAGDKFIYTIEAAGYASIWNEIFGENQTIYMSKLDAKLIGIATYIDKSNNLNVVPSGTDITISVWNWYVQKEYTVKVGAEGVFEFSGLPYGADFGLSQITIGSDKYKYTSYIYGSIGDIERLSVTYSYIHPNETPFAAVSYQGKVTSTGDIVITFNKAVDIEFSQISAYCTIRAEYSYNEYNYTTFTQSWSNGNKTLTLTPGSYPWGKIYDYWDGVIRTYNNINIKVNLYSSANSAGVSENINKTFYFQIVE